MEKIVALAFALSTLFTMKACGQTAQTAPSVENTEIAPKRKILSVHRPQISHLAWSGAENYQYIPGEL